MLGRARLRSGHRFLLEFEDSDAVRMRGFENGVNDGLGFFIGNREIHLDPGFHLRRVAGSPLMAIAAAGALLGQVKSEDAELPHALVKIVQRGARDNGLYSFHIRASSGEAFVQ